VIYRFSASGTPRKIRSTTWREFGQVLSVCG
jgi:hypothetical protein